MEILSNKVKMRDKNTQFLQRTMKLWYQTVTMLVRTLVIVVILIIIIIIICYYHIIH